MGDTGEEGFALPLTGTDPYNDDGSENVGDEDNDLGTSKFDHWDTNKAMLDVSVRECQC